MPTYQQMYGGNPWMYGPVAGQGYNAAGSNSDQSDYEKELEDYRRSLIRTPQPNYVGARDSDSGLLRGEYTLRAQPNVKFKSNLSDLNSRLAGINLNTQGLEAIRNRALGTGPSAWAQLMLEKQGIEQGTRLDELMKQSNAAQAAARSALASHGGLSSGARERLATKGMRDELMGRQAAGRAGQTERLGILTQDEQDRLNLLKGLPSMEVQALEPQFQKTNIWATLANSEAGRQQDLSLANRAYSTDVEKNNIDRLFADTQGYNKFQQDKWAKQMEAWGADMQAKAQEQAGKK